MDSSAPEFDGHCSPPPAYDERRPGSSTPVRNAWQQDEPSKQPGGPSDNHESTLPPQQQTPVSAWNNQFYTQPPPMPWAVPPGPPPNAAGGMYPGRPLQAGYYPPTGVAIGYQPPPQYFGFAPRQSMQQQVMVIGGHGQTPVHISAVESFCAHIILACFVTWFCNILLGAIAFALAMAANSSTVTNPHGAHQLGRASYCVSVVGIVTTVIVVTLVLSVVVNSTKTTCTGYQYNSRCFRSYCSGTCTYNDCVSQYRGVYATNGFCYYNSY